MFLSGSGIETPGTGAEPAGVNVRSLPIVTISSSVGGFATVKPAGTSKKSCGWLDVLRIAPLLWAIATVPS